MPAVRTDAVVFVLSRYLFPDVERCVSHCLVHGYNAVGVVKDNWKQAMDYLNEGKATVLVVADPEHLDPKRSPRIEVADPLARRPRHDRTRIIRRDEEE